MGFAVICAVAALFIGAGRLGADVGGVITLGAGAAAAVLASLPGGITRRAVVVAVLTPVLAVAVLAVVDVISGGDAHLTRSVLAADSPGELVDIAERRFDTSWDGPETGHDSAQRRAVRAGARLRRGPAPRAVRAARRGPCLRRRDVGHACRHRRGRARQRFWADGLPDWRSRASPCRRLRHRKTAGRSSNLAAVRIALVSPYSYTYPGGVGRHVEALAHELLREGHDVRLLAPYDPDDRHARVSHRGARPDARPAPDHLIPLGRTVGLPDERGGLEPLGRAVRDRDARARAAPRRLRRRPRARAERSRGQLVRGRGGALARRRDVPLLLDERLLQQRRGTASAPAASTTSSTCAWPCRRRRAGRRSASTAAATGSCRTASTSRRRVRTAAPGPMARCSSCSSAGPRSARACRCCCGRTRG